MLIKAPKTANGYDTYICPICSNGSGNNGTGIATKNGKTFKCFKCGHWGSISSFINMSGKIYEKPIVNTDKVDTKKMINKDSKNNHDYRMFYLRCSRELVQNSFAIEYLNKRGISLPTALSNNVGFCNSWKNPVSESKYHSSRIIFFMDYYSYSARSIDGTNTRYKTMKVGNSQFYLLNRDIITGNTYNILDTASNKTIFIVEGEFDALSIRETGKEVIALCGTGNTNQLLKDIRKRPNNINYCIWLDNDEAGVHATNQLTKSLTDLKISFKVNNQLKYNDPNDYLINDRVGFFEQVNNMVYN